MKIKFKMTIERLIIIVLVLGYVVQIPSYLAKRECVKVEGKVTTFLDLAKSPHKESYIETKITNNTGEVQEFFELIMTSEIVGQSNYTKSWYDNPYTEPIFKYSFYNNSILPVKLTNRSKTLLTDFELYSYDEELYILTYFAVNKARAYYTALYKYSDVDLEHVIELSEKIKY